MVKTSDAVQLTGYLICQGRDEVKIVERYLPNHIELTLAEAGCLSFRVEQTEDPLVWMVAEKFSDERACADHQTRAKASEWGQATVGIKRDYEVQRGVQ